MTFQTLKQEKHFGSQRRDGCVLQAEGEGQCVEWEMTIGEKASGWWWLDIRLLKPITSQYKKEHDQYNV